MSLSSDIREYALSLGYDRVGFTTADKFATYEEELIERAQMYDWGMEGNLQLLKAADPKSILPEAKSIVVTVYDYFRQSFPQEMSGKIGRLYQSYGGFPPHQPIHRARYRLLREFLEKRGCHVGRGFVEPPSRMAAARSGVATFGKNCFAFARGIGSFIVIGTFVIDAELEYDESTMEVECPVNCTICLDSCPTGALYEPLRMDPRRCIAYNSYATPMSLLFGNGQEILPLEIRDLMGSWIYGCDICQEVCPRNQARLEMKLPPSAYLERIADVFSLDKLLNMTDEHFNRVFTLLQNIREKRYFQRNAAVALGNLGNETSVPALALAMQDPDMLVRGHVAWALGKIGSGKARRVLEDSLAVETSEYVQREIATALADKSY